MTKVSSDVLAKGTVEQVPASLMLMEDYSNYAGDKGQPQPFSFRDLYPWIRSSPELLEVTTNIAHDIWGEGFDFIGEKSNIERANKFARLSRFKEYGMAWTNDSLLTGNGYLGIARQSRDNIKNIIKNVRSQMLGKSGDYGSEYFDLEMYSKIKKQNPDMFLPKSLYPIRSSTIYINYNQRGGEIISYVQKTDTSPQWVSFDPDEVIHLAWNRIGDAVYGLSPAVSGFNEIVAIYYAKQYAKKFFENDATPNLIINLPNDAPRSPNYQNIVEQLKTYQKNPHKHMVTTGTIGIERVNQFGKDLEFRQLIKEFTSVFKRAWGYPADEDELKTPDKLERYYRRVNLMQEQLEDLLNIKLWSEFEVEMKFKKIYKRDESREADIVNKLVGVPVMTINEGRKYLGYEPIGSEGDVLQASLASKNPTGFNQPKEPKSQEQTADARREQVEEDEEMMSPEESVDRMIKSQNLQKGETLTIPFDYLVAIVEKFNPFDKAKIFFSETADIITLMFSDGLYKYKSRIIKNTIKDMENFRFAYLRNAVPIESEE